MIGETRGDNYEDIHRSSSPVSYFNHKSSHECHLRHPPEVINAANNTGGHLNPHRHTKGLSYRQQQALATLVKFGGDAVVKALQLYIEEFKEGFKVLMDEKSIDERLANIIYSVEMKTVVDFDFFKFNSGDPLEDKRNELLAGGPKKDDELCGQHLGQMLAQADELAGMLERKRQNSSVTLRLKPKHIHLARVLDSFGRYESGYMSGRTHSFGSYEQCLNTPLKLAGQNDDHHDDEKITDVGARFCWARLNIDRHLNSILRSRKKTTFEPGSHVLSVGICIPESCHSSSFTRYEHLFQRLVGMQFKLPQSMYLEEKLRVESVFCLVDDESELAALPTSGKLVLAFMLLWLLSTLFVTTFIASDSYLEEEKSGDTWLECLDLKRSWRDFVGDKRKAVGPIEDKGAQQARRVEFNTLNPVRWLGCAFVVWAHALLVRMGFSQDQLHLPYLLETETSGGLVIVSSAVVDTFFAITGILMAYITMRRSAGPTQQSVVAVIRTPADQATDGNSTNKKAAPRTSLTRQFIVAYSQIVRARYLRLLPLLVLIYAFKRTVFVYLGSGPLWDFGLNRETAYGACKQESWLVPFAFWSSFKPLSRQCLMQSWSVSCDMYATVFLAPVLIIMTRRPKVATFMLAAICLLSYQWLLVAISRLDPGDGFAVRDLRAQGMGAIYARISHVYTYPMYRISSFAIGMLAGHALHWYEADESRQWPGWFRGPGTKFSLFYIASVFTLLANGSKLRHAIHPFHLLLFPSFMTLGKLLWALSNCLVFLRMMTDWNQSFLMRAAAGKFWQALSKLNYGILLMHFDLLFLDISWPPQGNLNNMYSIFQAFTTVYLVSSGLSLLTFVVFENPMDKLVKLLTERRRAATRRPQAKKCE